ncbi:hypothetical protein [Methyloceanibacter methanicus]|uniref:hypothetical protein n=1 Tax=Methyloceanibacter methanicus TaxID=1774968 RepID=UPI00313A057D
MQFERLAENAAGGVISATTVSPPAVIWVPNEAYWPVWGPATATLMTSGSSSPLQAASARPQAATASREIKRIMPVFLR